MGVGASTARAGDRFGVRSALPVLLADGTCLTETAATSHRVVHARRPAGSDRMVDGGVRRQQRADFGRALSVDDPFLSGAADYLLLLLALARLRESRRRSAFS